MASSRARAAAGAPERTAAPSRLLSALEAGMKAAPRSAADAARDVGTALAESVGEILTDPRWLIAFDASFEEVGLAEFKRNSWDGRIDHLFRHCPPNAVVDGQVVSICIKAEDRVELHFWIDKELVAQTQAALASGSLLAHELLERIESQNEPPATRLALAAAPACAPARQSPRDREHQAYETAFVVPARSGFDAAIAKVTKACPLGATELSSSVGWSNTGGFSFVLTLKIPGLERLLFGPGPNQEKKRGVR